MDMSQLALDPTFRAQYKKTMLPRAKAHQMPGRLYTSPEIFAAEKEQVFMKTWLCVGREEQIANPGDYIRDLKWGPTQNARPDYLLKNRLRYSTTLSKTIANVSLNFAF
jgi:hypothetical protein